MRKLLVRYGGLISAVAIVFATVVQNRACCGPIYQPPVPEEAKKLRRF